MGIGGDRCPPRDAVFLWEHEEALRPRETRTREPLLRGCRREEEDQFAGQTCFMLFYNLASGGRDLAGDWVQLSSGKAQPESSVWSQLRPTPHAAALPPGSPLA